MNVAKDHIFYLVEVFDPSATSVATDDGLDEQGRLVPDSKLFIDEERRECFLEDVLPEEGVDLCIWSRL